MQKINLAEANPTVRYSKTLLLPNEFNLNSVHALDERLVYLYSGSAKIRMEDHTYNATRGSLFLWSSASRYSIINTSDGDTKIMSINFDYTSGENHPSLPIPTVPDRVYRSENAVENVQFADVQQFNAPIHLDGMQHLERVFGEMTDEFISPKPYSAMMLSMLMKKVLVVIARKLTLGGGEKPTGLVERVIEYIHENYAGDLSNEALGKLFNYHPNYINRVMQKHTGQSLHQYVLTCRVSKALEMLQTTGMSVTEVSERVGFASIKHFSQTFKSIYGYSPIHFRD